MAKKKEQAPQVEPHDEEFEKIDGPTPEMERDIELRGQNRVHFEGLGDAWAVLTGMNPAALIPQVVGTVIQAGGTRPAWQWKKQNKEYVFMAWPREEPLRAAVLMSGDEGQEMKPIAAVPLLEGVPNDLLVEEVHQWSGAPAANVAVTMIEGKNPMWFFDPLYGRDASDLTPGITHTFLLAGLAYSLRKALLDEVTITNGPQYEQWAAEWLEENPGKTRLDVPPLKVPVSGRHIILPGRRFCEYQVRALVDEVQETHLDKMPVKILYMSFPFGDREPLRLALYVSRMAHGDYEPQKGDEVDAYLWLQGRIIDMDEGAPLEGSEGSTGSPVQ